MIVQTIETLAVSTTEVAQDSSAYRFLNPDNFRTSLDVYYPGIEDAQYRKGLELGYRYCELHISVENTWSVYNCPGDQFASNEKIGTACTASLLQGFLDSGCKIVVHSTDKNGLFISTTIKEGIEVFALC